MDTSKVVILGLVVVLLAGGLYAFNSKNSAEVDKNAMNESQMQQDAMKKDQMAKAEMDKKVATDKMAADKLAGVMVGGALMVPNLDIVDNAVNASNVTTLVTAVKAAGLVETLKGSGPFTVFAPSNAAFEALPKGTVESLVKIENKAKLSNILTYHVVAGRYLAADLKDGQKLKTVQGQELTISKKDGKIIVNGSAAVETADVISSNGVTFVIDGVLMPK